MWITQTETCTDCRSDVTLVTDGRLAYADSQPTDASPRRTFPSDTADVARDGHELVLACPAITEGDYRCRTEVRFTGEGTSCPDYSSIAEAILDSVAELV